MDKVSVIGLGKLGLPIAVTLAERLAVHGYDVLPDLRRFRPYEHREQGHSVEHPFQEIFEEVYREGAKEGAYRGLRFADSLVEAVRDSSVVFLAVQTPHQPEFEGVTPLPEARADFDYSYLVRVVKEMAPLVRPEQTVALISTVLPGTIRREILPILKGKCKLVYNPFFIAMGTVMHDFLNPEFVLLGGSPEDTGDLFWFYSGFYISDSPSKSVKVHRVSFESAELIKMGYNAYITQKIGYVNTLMEIAHKIPGCNVDEVTDALKDATDRLISPKYLTAGMGDGGGCHPRDSIAMSFLARKLALGKDIFEDAMLTRERQAKFLANIASAMSILKGLPIILLGKSFKPETDITTGSPAVLLANILKSQGFAVEHMDPYIGSGVWFNKTAVYVLATKHDSFKTYTFPKGSIIIDPFRYISKQEGVDLIPVGIGSTLV